MSYPPQQGGFSSYSGLGAYAPPPPPKRNRTLVIVLSVLGAVVLLGGAITAVVLLTRPSTGPQAVTTPPKAPPPVVQISNDSAGVRYDVPASWQRDTAARGEAGGVALAGVASDYPFTCGGQSLIRAQVLSGSKAGSNPSELAAETAAALAESSYTVDAEPPGLGTPQAKVLTRGGHQAVQITFTATTPGNNPCYAPKGQVTAVAVATSTGASVVVLNVAQGGPHADQNPTAAQVTALLASVTPIGGGG